MRMPTLVSKANTTTAMKRMRTLSPKTKTATSTRSLLLATSTTVHSLCVVRRLAYSSTQTTTSSSSRPTSPKLRRPRVFCSAPRKSCCTTRIAT
ncbi:hypothetical protein BN1708_019045 [Verticillium longisporum]|uniref:Uncharacterized protein n=1 Tax=Verticillium longisporum TaxID=100787 RepID=A0A0G4MES2_VERLO|nr:hypothetical protein BN1708_019045 [Verticillium longisporum]